MRTTILTMGILATAMCLVACGDDETGDGTSGAGNTGNTGSSSGGSGSGGEASGGSGSGGEATGGTGSGGEATGGTGGMGTGGMGSGGMGQGGGGSMGEFGSMCANDDECNDPLVCFTFGMGEMLCTKTCMNDADCAPESNKCNNMGHCKAN
jgi:hypothetical protein